MKTVVERRRSVVAREESDSTSTTNPQHQGSTNRPQNPMETARNQSRRLTIIFQLLIWPAAAWKALTMYVSQSVSAYPCPSTAGMMVDPRHNITLTPIAGNLHTRNARAPAINPQQVTPREQHAIGKSKMVVGRESGVSKQAKSTQETKETNYQVSFK